MPSDIQINPSIPESSPRVALTGGTGFIGQRLLRELAAQGLQISALTRQHMENDARHKDIRWVTGDLSTPDALERLIDGADCVLHLAGATKALTAGEFHAINADATHRIAQLCAQKGVKHLIFLSSLAATRPFVSPYAASKAAAEQMIEQFRADMKITIIRAPAVLGPEDSATYPLFVNLARGLLPVPGGAARNARFSIIDVADLTALLTSLTLSSAETKTPIAPFGHENLSWSDMAASASRILNRPVRQLVIPGVVMSAAARVADLFAKLNGRAQVFSSDKLREMRAGDWIATSAIDNPISLDDTLRRCLTPFLEQSGKTV